MALTMFTGMLSAKMQRASKHAKNWWRAESLKSEAFKGISFDQPESFFFAHVSEFSKYEHSQMKYS